ncbi:MAG: hypothetical protein Q8O16_06510 [Dehalococcoidia bacterium]|nr:hypothetical protein [Dehalococcoidia bacterium]
MTRIIVDPGICGFKATVEVARQDRLKVKISIATECDMIKALGAELAELDWREALGKPSESPVYKCAFRHIKHTACPLPSAVLKAVEVEVGAALPRDVVFHFEK